MSAPDLAAGKRPAATRLPFTIGDRIAAQVDVGTGNLLVTTSQLSMPRIAGSLSLGLAYNSLALAPGPRSGSSIGPGWRFSTGSDVRLASNPDGSVTYVGGDRSSQPRWSTAPPQPRHTRGWRSHAAAASSSLLVQPLPAIHHSTVINNSVQSRLRHLSHRP